MSESPQIRPLKRVEYDFLVGTGAFEGERIELLEGELVVVGPTSPGHAFAVTELTEILIGALGNRALVRVRQPIALSEVSEPEPDISIVARGDYSREHPSSALLVIEVAVSSVQKDLVKMARIYARAGFPEYWVVDVPRGVVVRHLSPQGDQYRAITEHGRDERLALQSFPDIVVDVGRILPKRS